MRIIEQKMLRACWGAMPFALDNTQVVPVKGQTDFECEVYLHGHLIATTWVIRSELKVVFERTTLRNYPTRTTCSRLRALGVKVSVKGGLPHIGGVSLHDMAEEVYK